MEAFLIVVVIFVFLLVVFLVLAFAFPDDLRALLRRTSSVEVTRDGLKIALVAEVVEQKEGRHPSTSELERLASGIPAGRHILWVDDQPANNRAEIQALRSLGLRVDTATSNEEGLSYTKVNTYDLVLSDIGRLPPQPDTAGLDLPMALSEVGVRAPVAFYVGKVREPATQAGQPVFDTPTALLIWVREQLAGPAS
jgi:CheY-like chemotaxis protein